MTGSLERGIYLASRSPRRRDLLSQIGVRYHLLLFRTRPGEGPDVDETPLAGESPGAYVERVARAKAESGWQRMMQRNLPQAPVLAADTTVALGTSILGKPADRQQAAAILAALSGQTHQVLSAVALKQADGAQHLVRLAGKRGEDRGGLLAVGGLAQDARPQRHRGVGGQHRRLRQVPLHHALPSGLGLGARHALHVRAGRFAGERGLVHVG